MDAINRRGFARIAMAGPAAYWLLPALAQAVVGKLLVGYPAGGTLDTTARHLTEAWRKLGRQYIVDNRAGAAGRIVNSQLKRERADGSVLLCTHASALTIYPQVYTRLAYDPGADFVPISPVVSATCAFAVSSAVPASVSDLKTYVEWVRRTPGSAMYASPAAGSFAHFLGYQLSDIEGLHLQHVGYRGSAPAMQDLIGGQIPSYFGFVADFLPYMQQRKLRILGVSGDTRTPFMPKVPTFVEQGYPKIRGVENYGIFAPPGTPDSTVQSLHASIVTASKDPTLRTAFEQIGLEPLTLSPGEYARQLQSQREFWRPIVQASGFRSED